MAGYTASDLQKIVDKYCKTTSGKAVLKQGSVQNTSNADKLAGTYVMLLKQTLLNDIGENFRVDAIIYTVAPNEQSGLVEIKIAIPQNILYRPSLYISEGGGEMTGEGINDIVALFVNGYNAKNKVHGYWASRPESGMIWSRKSRSGIPAMISSLIDAACASTGFGKADVITSEYPDGWV